jgi:hypothetical protein
MEHVRLHGPLRVRVRLTNPCADAMHLNRDFNEISDYCLYVVSKSKWGSGDNTMRYRAIPATTMIVAAGLIGITQARLPRPVRDYRDRVTVEMSDIALHDTIANWLGARTGASFGRQMLRS